MPKIDQVRYWVEPRYHGQNVTINTVTIRVEKTWVPCRQMRFFFTLETHDFHRRKCEDVRRDMSIPRHQGLATRKARGAECNKKRASRADILVQEQHASKLFARSDVPIVVPRMMALTGR